MITTQIESSHKYGRQSRSIFEGCTSKPATSNAHHGQQRPYRHPKTSPMGLPLNTASTHQVSDGNLSSLPDAFALVGSRIDFQSPFSHQGTPGAYEPEFFIDIHEDIDSFLAPRVWDGDFDTPTLNGSGGFSRDDAFFQDFDFDFPGHIAPIV